MSSRIGKPRLINSHDTRRRQLSLCAGPGRGDPPASPCCLCPSRRRLGWWLAGESLLRRRRGLACQSRCPSHPSLDRPGREFGFHPSGRRSEVLQQARASCQSPVLPFPCPPRRWSDLQDGGRCVKTAHNGLSATMSPCSLHGDCNSPSGTPLQQRACRSSGGIPRRYS